MTISKTAVYILLLSILMLASTYAWRSSVWNPTSDIASPTPPDVNAPKRDRAINVNNSESISANSVSRTPANQQDKAESNRIDRETEIIWGKLVRSTGLPNLKRTKFSPNDIEIRIWELPDFLIPKTKCWVFSRKDNEWKAFAFVDPEFNGKIIKKPLDTPLKGWLKWDSYVNSDIAPLKIREARPDQTPDHDAMETIIEVKFGNDYARNLVVDGDDLLTNLFKMIKSEFFSDDQAKWSKF